jgi:hypothetical protein
MKSSLKKVFLIGFISIIMVMMVLLLSVGTVWGADVVGTAGGTSTNVLSGALLFLLTSPMVWGAGIGIVILFLGWYFTRNPNAKYIFDLAVMAYEYAENQGVLNKLKGYDKFRPFMSKFCLEYHKQFGYPPTPGDKGMAVAIMEQKVLDTELGK